jgi:hypothetical protein
MAGATAWGLAMAHGQARMPATASETDGPEGAQLEVSQSVDVSAGLDRDDLGPWGVLDSRFPDPENEQGKDTR